MVRMAYACLLPFDRAQMMGVLDSHRKWKSDYRKGPISVSNRQISRESIRFTRIFRVSLHHRQASKLYSFVFAQSIHFTLHCYLFFVPASCGVVPLYCADLLTCFPSFEIYKKYSNNK